MNRGDMERRVGRDEEERIRGTGNSENWLAVFSVLCLFSRVTTRFGSAGYIRSRGLRPLFPFCFCFLTQKEKQKILNYFPPSIF